MIIHWSRENVSGPRISFPPEKATGNSITMKKSGIFPIAVSIVLLIFSWGGIAIPVSLPSTWTGNTSAACRRVTAPQVSPYSDASLSSIRLPFADSSILKPLSPQQLSPQEICECEGRLIRQRRLDKHTQVCQVTNGCLRAHDEIKDPFVYDPVTDSCAGTTEFWYDFSTSGVLPRTTNTWVVARDTAEMDCQSESGSTDTSEPVVTDTPNETATPNPNLPVSKSNPADVQQIIQDLINILTNPAIPISGAVVGTLLAALLAALWGGVAPPPVQNLPASGPHGPKAGDVDANGRVFSPVAGGGWVSREMYDYQKNLLAKGWRWDSTSGKFVIQEGTINEDGKIYSGGDPNGEGSRWLTREEYERDKNLRAQGLVYDPTFGYQKPGEASAIKERFSRQARADDAASNVKIKAEMDALRQKQAAEREREEYIDVLKDRQLENEVRMEHARQAAENEYSTDMLLAAAQNEARQVFTGLTPDGKFSYAALAVRGLAAGISAGQSEIFFQSLNSLYTEKDAIDRGATGTQAVGAALGEVMVMEGAGRILGASGKGVGNAFAKVFPNATKSIIQNSVAVSNRLEFLNKPVSEIFSGYSEAAAKQAAESALSPAEKQVLEAVKRGEDPAKLLSGDKRKILGGLEQKGLVTPDEARPVINQLTGQVNQSVNEAADEAAHRLRLETGVQIDRVGIADSGSSGITTGVNRSLMSDADRSVMLGIDKDSLAVYAHENQMTPQQGYDALMQRYKNLMDESVDRSLKSQGFQNGAQDVDYKTYAGISGKSGPVDTYPSNYTAARTAMGKASVRTYNPNGDLTGAHGTSGRSFLDELNLEQQKHTGILPEDPAGKIDAGELRKIADQQMQSATSHNDLKSIAKAGDRIGLPAARLGIVTDPTLSQAAKEIVRNPQQMNDVLKKFGLSLDEFISGTRDQIQAINQGIQGGVP
jgi:hypothetical protein